MKKRNLLLWLSVWLLLLGAMSCHKDEAPPLPPDIPEEPPYVPPADGLKYIEAKDAVQADFINNLNQTVRVHGHLVVRSGRSAFEFKDHLRVELYIERAKLATLPADIKAKLLKEGQELTIVGKFIEFTTGNGFVKKQIEYKSIQDLVFDNTPPPPRPPAETIPLLEASKITMAKDFVQGKEIRLHGVITHLRILGVKNFTTRAFMTLADGNEIQIYNEDQNTYPQEIKDKLFKVGTELTVRGIFNEYYTREVLYNSLDDITFHN